jgi:hypothetical protein
VWLAGITLLWMILLYYIPLFVTVGFSILVYFRIAKYAAFSVEHPRGSTRFIDSPPRGMGGQVHLGEHAGH